MVMASERYLLMTKRKMMMAVQAQISLAAWSAWVRLWRKESLVQIESFGSFA